MNEHTDDWAKVQAALANPAWDFRTLDGITRDTSLPRERVERVLLRIRSMLAPPHPTVGSIADAVMVGSCRAEQEVRSSNLRAPTRVFNNLRILPLEVRSQNGAKTSATFVLLSPQRSQSPRETVLVPHASHQAM